MRIPIAHNKGIKWNHKAPYKTKFNGLFGLYLASRGPVNLHSYVTPKAASCNYSSHCLPGLSGDFAARMSVL